MTEADVTSKVRDLMEALDEVRRYKALTSLMVDFVMIILATVASLFSVEILVNYLHASSEFPCSFLPNAFGCGIGSTVTGFSSLVALTLFVIPAVGILCGVVWVDRKFKRVKVGEWRTTLDEGLPGAVKLLTQMKWDSVFEEIQLSKIGYLVYGLVKVAGYFVFVSFLSIFATTFVFDFAIHVIFNLDVVIVVAFVLVLVLSRKDLEKRYRQTWSLDGLIWELRWFSGEFGSASFKT